MRAHIKLKQSFAMLGLFALVLTSFQNCGDGGAMDDEPSVTTAAPSAETVQSMLKSADDTCADYKIRVFPTSSTQVIADSTSLTGVQVGFFKATHVVAIKDGSGSVALLGTAPGAKIDSISLFAGTFIFCDVNVGTITGVSHGVLSLSNGSIDSVNGFNGDITVSKGRVSEIKNIRGNIVYKELNGNTFARTY